MKNKIISMSLVLAVLVLCGCVKEDDLLQLNPNEMDSGNFWKTDLDAFKGVNAVYQAFYYDGTYLRSTQIMIDTKSDDTRSNSPWGAMANIGKFNSSVALDDIYGWGFRDYYIGMYRANQVLEHVPDIEMEDQGLKNRVLGQAYFLRGLLLMHAVKMFNNVPVPNTTEIYHEQKTQAEGWAQVIADFEAAAELLPVSYTDVSGLDAGQVGRATKGAALGYLGKAKLFTYDYEGAKTAFEAVMNLGVYDLVPNYRDNFTDKNENNMESVFEIQFDRDVGGLDLGWVGAPGSSWSKTTARAITYGPRGFGYVDVQPTWVLFDEFHEEATVSGDVDPRLNATIFYDGGDMLYGHDFATVYANSPADINDLFCAKYQNSDGTYPDEFDWRSGINERLMRYADVLLMYAEVLNELDRTADAAPYIQRVRNRVNLPDRTTEFANMSQQQMRDQIAHERFLEFGLEGHRFDDIRRWGWLDDPSKLTWLETRDPEFETYVEGREYFPIPQREIDNNPFPVEQNPGY
ncbi:RagB/SusD family nutrient uptake outer membrane protein [Galbibacter sp. EGI 63066]|uniref:RagB/SusD family nutrient uptake outer membrane protein n=1 Tax=Galbibacter sp. EGI 63066 TaxID=2993559 RepID=UPI002248869C|nr:RagB/SusD family nutrient uptake outer membrane protein [Galbibacter sp. EGI 63066]MCX2680464.1 RagB/SusD family nutrient uptake outer membrane protein [Galbibacter sp. EGI 63066]